MRTMQEKQIESIGEPCYRRTGRRSSTIQCKLLLSREFSREAFTHTHVEERMKHRFAYHALPDTSNSWCLASGVAQPAVNVEGHSLKGYARCCEVCRQRQMELYKQVCVNKSNHCNIAAAFHSETTPPYLRKTSTQRYYSQCRGSRARSPLEDQHQ